MYCHGHDEQYIVLAPCGRSYSVCMVCDKGINDCTENECAHVKEEVTWH